jgi:ATP-dependent Lon protease
LSFVGNIDLSVEQVVNSTEYDLFQPLPPELDLAVMDRFAAYIPGWEMPKNSSEFLTNRYGFITDYLAEAFHYQFKHTNRYEEVSRRIRLGKAIEGRDEKGIKKTVAAFLKILHPDSGATDEEFEEYVAYATECRRRVKEQMNKRKPDDEFARINLSYYGASGEEIVVFCPESKDALATQQPERRRLNEDETEDTSKPRAARPDPAKSEPSAAPVQPSVDEARVEAAAAEPQEQHFTILYGDTGHSYESIMGPYIRGAKAVTIEDPYIRLPHQIQNFVRFCETCLKSGTVKSINLITGYDDKTQLADISEKIEDLKQSLLEMDVVLSVKLNPNMHDREIRMDNGWVIKIGRGLDFYQRPGSWFEVGTNDLSLRKCLETKVDIFKTTGVE